tara:strand:- start:261 stop:587 length:327 start_codon:yes stop_codon:yes gene_type:complete
MGKLSVADANELLESGVIDKATLSQMQEQGLVSQRRKSTERYIKAGNGAYVNPIVYFRGLGSGKYTPEMQTLRDEINNVIAKHTITKHEMTKIESDNRTTKTKRKNGK